MLPIVVIVIVVILLFNNSMVQMHHFSSQARYLNSSMLTLSITIGITTVLRYGLERLVIIRI